MPWESLAGAVARDKLNEFLSKGGARSLTTNYQGRRKAARVDLSAQDERISDLAQTRSNLRTVDIVKAPLIVSSPPASKPRKSLGQHFLVDDRILDRILAAADLTAEDVALEIGPGRGALTRRLLSQAAQVVAVELDDNLAAALPGRLGNPPNLTVVAADARTVDIGSLVGGGVNQERGDRPAYKVVANLPYYAANPIIRRFLESEWRPRLMVLMLQREVADSMTAVPGKMSLLSVATQYYATPRPVCAVPPGAFRPVPKVTSAVVRLDLRERPAVAVSDTEAFFDLVRAGFSAPRKQLRNSLSHGLGLPGGTVGELLDAGGVDGRRRAETLAIEEWAAVYTAWEAWRRELTPEHRGEPV